MQSCVCERSTWNEWCVSYTKRRDALQTYRIAATSGVRGKLFKIFSLHIASSKWGPWKCHDFLLC